VNLVNYLPPPRLSIQRVPGFFSHFHFSFPFVFFFWLIFLFFHCAVFRVVVFAPVTTGDADCWRWPSPEIVPRVTSRPVRSPTRASCSSFKKITRRLFSISLPRFSPFKASRFTWSLFNRFGPKQTQTNKPTN
jgi:hypothetical protein